MTDIETGGTDLAAGPDDADTVEEAATPALDERQSWQEADRRRIRRTRRTLVTILVVLIILLLVAFWGLAKLFQPLGTVATGEQAKGITWVHSIYGWGKAKDQQFTGPQGVAIGPDGTIWATTQAQHRVVGFNPDGSLAAMLYQGEIGKAQFPNAFGYPVAVAVDPAGLVYIADDVRNTVWVSTRDNRIVRSIYVPRPASVAVSSDRLVVGSASGFVIMTPTGQVLKVIGRQGKAVGQFQGVRGVSIGKDGTIYVVDQYNNRVSAYDKDGGRKWIVVTGLPGNEKPVKKSTLPTQGTAPAAMQIPGGMTIDGAGRLVIADPFGFDLTALNGRDGSLNAKYGAPGNVDGQFIYPSSVAYDSSRDWFAIADTGNQRVQIVRLPNSGGSAVSGANRAMSGWLRACLLPLLLLLLALVAGLIYRYMRRRKEARDAEAEKAAKSPQKAGS